MQNQITNTLIKSIIVLLIATDVIVVYYFGIREPQPPKYTPIEVEMDDDYYPLDDSGYIPRSPVQ